MVELRHLGGALARPPEVPNAVGNRDAAFMLFTVSVGFPGQEDQIRAFQRRLLDGMSSWATGGVYLNFMNTSQAEPERVHAAFRPADFGRLATLQAVYDPRNLFRLNFNIPPQAARTAARHPRSKGQGTAQAGERQRVVPMGRSPGRRRLAGFGSHESGPPTLREG